jgi:hypothetical protein
VRAIVENASAFIFEPPCRHAGTQLLKGNAGWDTIAGLILTEGYAKKVHRFARYVDGN